MKKIWILTLIVLCLFVAAFISPGNIIASTDETQEEMQYDEGQDAYDEEAVEGESAEEDMTDEELMDDGDEAGPEEEIFMEEPDAGKI